MNITLGNIVFDTRSVSVNSVAVYILLLTFLMTFAFLNWSNVFNGKRYPNGPWGVPILGHLLFFGRSPPHTFSKWRKQYGDIFAIRLGSWNTIVVNGYDTIKEAADKPNDDFSSRPGFTTQRVISDRTGEPSLAFGQFDETYLYKRKVAASALRKFTNRSGNVTEDMIVEEANIMVDSFLSKDYSEPQQIMSDIQYGVARIIYKFLYGRAVQIDEHVARIVETVNKFIKFAGGGNPLDVMPWLRYVMPWKVKRMMQLLGALDGLRHQLIKEHEDTFTKDSIRDVLDAFLSVEQEENRLSRSALFTTLGDLQGAGFDTTNKTIQWLTLYMANYPDVQKRVQAEIDDVIGSGINVKHKDSVNLIYTEATILEAMRMSTLVPFAIPKYTTRDTQLNGLDIDKDTVVFFNLHSIAYDLEYWGDPDVFRPARFLTENEEQLDPTKCNRILPFGVGRRRCVGEYLAKMEILIIFTTMMRRCSIVKPEGVQYNLEPIPGLVYSPREFKVIVKERT